MKLHYSQTVYKRSILRIYVLLPYEITLLSNIKRGDGKWTLVLLPYEITLLSNSPPARSCGSRVLLPYEITLLSN